MLKLSHHYTPTGLTTFWWAATRVEFDIRFASREVTEVDGVPVSVISLTDLKRNKRSVGRTEDLADLEQLE